jgi:hypothetical protein
VDFQAIFEAKLTDTCPTAQRRPNATHAAWRRARVEHPQNVEKGRRHLTPNLLIKIDAHASVANYAG